MLKRIKTCLSNTTMRETSLNGVARLNKHRGTDINVDAILDFLAKY